MEFSIYSSSIIYVHTHQFINCWNLKPRMVLSVIQGCEEASSVVSSVFASRYVQDPPPRFDLIFIHPHLCWSMILQVLCTNVYRKSVLRYKLPEKSMSKEAAYQIVHDELLLDGIPRLNLASFVTTWMEPECDKLMTEAINKNFVDMDEYPVTTELQVIIYLRLNYSTGIKISVDFFFCSKNRCVNIIAGLFNAPSANPTRQAVGVGTVGSSEAIMLAGLAFKKKWQNKRKAQGKPFDKPNIVTGANVQVKVLINCLNIHSFR